MSGTLTLTKGSPKWWNSSDIWVQPHGTADSGPPGVTPVAGSSYDVWVRVHDMYPDASDAGWNLFVEWAIPTAGNTPVIAANFLNGTVSGGVVNGLPVGIVAASSHADIKCATTWVPVYENGGHECLIAVVYHASVIGGVPVDPGPKGSLGSLNGNSPGEKGDWSIAQHNLGVLNSGGHPIRYRFGIGGITGAEGGVMVVAEQAPLSEIAAFLPGVPGGQTVLQHPGKVEGIGIVPSANPNAQQIEAAQPRLEGIKIPAGGHSEFTLCGIVRQGNALINVTQHLNGRVVGGISVLVLGGTQ